MARSHRQQIMIVGCGRVGAELALSIFRQNRPVTVIDVNPRAFDRLGPNFRGRTIQGDVLEQTVLARAGIEATEAFAAVTTSDSVNIVSAWVARDRFQVPHVVARVYNPRREVIYEKLGLQTIASSSWGAQRIEQLMLQPGLQSILSAGNGEVQIYEVRVPHAWQGQTVAQVLPPGAIAVALTRGGRAALPAPDMVLRPHDILQVSATAEHATQLLGRLSSNGKD